MFSFNKRSLNLKYRFDERYIHEWSTHVNKNLNSSSYTPNSNTKASANSNANAKGSNHIDASTSGENPNIKKKLSMTIRVLNSVSRVWQAT